MGRTPVFPADTLFQDSCDDPHQCRRGSRRNIRTYAFLRCHTRLYCGALRKPCRSSRSRAEFRACGNGRTNGWSDAGAYDRHLPHCGDLRRLCPADTPDSDLYRLFRNSPDLREILHLHQANSPERRPSDPRQRPGGPYSDAHQ